jgi:predicted DNA-binding transcriptional regulator AlpA
MTVSLKTGTASEETIAELLARVTNALPSDAVCLLTRLLDHVRRDGLGAHDKILSLPETAEFVGVSLATLLRRIADGEGPVVTVLSKRRKGVRVRHLLNWLDQRALQTHQPGDTDAH